MIGEVYSTIEKFSMLSGVKSIVVGVSGGADSIALLHFLLNVSKSKGIKIIAAHVNHKLRGEESERDEKFVSSVCNSLGIDLYTKREDIKSLSRKLGQGLEECGRNIRYRHFNDLASTNDSKIATAHTLSDNIETLIFNLIRGSGLNGLCGIPPVRDKIIRPFIYTSRSEIEEYCKKKNLNFITDSTNFERCYTRNKIRIDIIPILKEINPGLDSSVKRLIENLTTDERYLEELTDREFKRTFIDGGFDAQKIQILPQSIKKRVIIKIIKSITNKEISKKHIDLIVKLINGEIGSVDIDRKSSISISKNSILYISDLSYNKSLQTKWEYKLSHVNILTEVKKTFIINMFSYEEYAKIFRNDNKVIYNSFDISILDENKKRELVLRNRRPGDKFSPLNRGITKTIKKLFNELKIPIENRENLVLLAKENEIIWIHGIGVSEKYKITSDTKQVATILER